MSRFQKRNKARWKSPLPGLPGTMIQRWGYRPKFHDDSSCGSVVLATLLGICCQEADMLMDLYTEKGWNGYTNVSHIRNVVEMKDIWMTKTSRYDGLTELPRVIEERPVALFIQLEGPWIEKGWRSAYSYTHWALYMGGKVMDYNNQLIADQISPMWFLPDLWEDNTMQRLVAGTEDCTGWHIRAAYEFMHKRGIFE